MKFEDLGLSPETLRAVTEKGYKRPLQSRKSHPHHHGAGDIVGLAQTEQGKRPGSHYR